MVFDALAKRPGFVPSLPELADEIEAHVTDALEPIAVHYTAAKPLTIAKHSLNSVHGCEAQHVANRGKFAWSLPLVRGTVLHKAIELLINVRVPRTPSDIVDDALDRIIESEGISASDYVASLSPAEQAELRATIIDLVTKYEDSFPPLKPEWRPVVESNAKVNLCGGAVFLTARTDLTIGAPGNKVIIDLKTGRTFGSHRDDLRLYALVDFLALGQAPRKVASYYIDSATIDAEDITEGALRTANRRLADGLVRAIEVKLAGRSPEVRPGGNCRWCALLDSCEAGRAHLAQRDEDDGW